MRLHFKKTLSMAFMVSLLSSAAQGGKYGGLFEDKIYDQTSLQSKTFLNKEEEKQAIKALLKEKKEEVLIIKYVNIIQKKIALYEAEYKAAIEGQVTKDLISVTIKGTLSGIKAALSSIPKVGDFLGKIFERCTQDIPDDTAKKIAKFPDAEHYASKVRDEILDLKVEIYDMQSSLHLEEIKRIEKKYVLKKRKITDANLCKKIEQALIKFRKSESGHLLKLVKRALELPVEIMHLDAHNLIAKLNNVQDYPYFQNYDESLREKIGSVIIQIAATSKQPDDSNYLGQNYFFLGEASSGKKTAARDLVKVSGLPNEEITVNPMSDTGYFVEMVKKVLTKTASNGEAYKNGLLIINGIDEVINHPEPNPDFKAFLYQLLIDKKIKDTDFELDVRRLNVIFTGKKDLIRNDYYQYIIPKISEPIHFSELNNFLNMGKILNDYLKELCNIHKINDIISFEFKKNSEVAVHYNKEIAKSYGVFNTIDLPSLPSHLPLKDVTIEILKERVKKIISTYKYILQTAGAIYYDQAEQTKDEDQKRKFFEKAAIYGNRAARLKLANILREEQQEDKKWEANFWYGQIIWAENPEFFPPLFHQDIWEAIKKKDEEIIQELLKRKVGGYNKNLFHITAAQESTEAEAILKALIELYRDGINLSGENDDTPIITAASHGRVKLVEVLHHEKPDVEKKNTAGHTALQVAQTKKKEEVIDFLLKNRSELIRKYSINEKDLLEKIEQEVKNSNNYQEASKVLGDMYAEGHIVETNHEKAWSYYKKHDQNLDKYKLHILYMKPTTSFFDFNINNIYEYYDGQEAKILHKELKGKLPNSISSRMSTDWPSTISAAPFKKHLYTAVIDKDYKIQTYVYKGAWEEIHIDPTIANEGISICSFREKLYLAYIRENNEIGILSYLDGQGWEELTSPSKYAYQTLSLCSFKDNLYLAYREGPNHRGINIIRFDEEKWSEPAPIISGVKPFKDSDVAKTAISLCTFNNSLYLGYTGGKHTSGNTSYTPNELWLTSSTQSEAENSWGTPIKISENFKLAGRGGISLCSFKNELHFYYLNKEDNKIYFKTWNGQIWGEPSNTNQEARGRFCVVPFIH